LDNIFHCDKIGSPPFKLSAKAAFTQSPDKGLNENEFGIITKGLRTMPRLNFIFLKDKMKFLFLKTTYFATFVALTPFMILALSLGIGCTSRKSKQESSTFGNTPHKFTEISGQNGKIQIMELPIQVLPQNPNPNGILSGGFSALNIVKKSDEILEFRTLTDRGPNSAQIPYLEGIGSMVRVFLLPTFSPTLAHFQWNIKTNSIEFTNSISLRDQAGIPLLGLPNRIQPVGNPDFIEIGVDSLGHRLPIAPEGVDPESICEDRDGNLWVGDEYGPNILIFDRKGNHLKTLTPGNGIPRIYETRKANRGFEGIACSRDKVYAMLQSPLPKNQILGGRDGQNSTESFFRILEIDPHLKKATGEFWDPMIDSKLDKIGDISWGPDERLYILVQNGKVEKKARQILYSLALPESEKNPVTDFSTTSKAPNTSLKNAFLTTKSIELDLSPYLNQFEKLEGLAVTANEFYLINDNDFGMNGSVDFATGKAEKDSQKKSYLIRIPRIP